MELKMEGLTKHYGSKVALDHLSFTMTKGVYGLLGPNGAGKSTMMNILAGNLRPTSGRVYWNGTDVQELGKEYRALLGFMPQQQALYPEFRGRSSCTIWRLWNRCRGVWYRSGWKLSCHW